MHPPLRACGKGYTRSWPPSSGFQLGFRYLQEMGAAGQAAVGSGLRLVMQATCLSASAKHGHPPSSCWQPLHKRNGARAYHQTHRAHCECPVGAAGTAAQQRRWHIERSAYHTAVMRRMSSCMSLSKCMGKQPPWPAATVKFCTLLAQADIMHGNLSSCSHPFPASLRPAITPAPCLHSTAP